MKSLYPPIQPYVSHSLAVGDGHVLHVEECGTMTGIPVVFLHGGPGGGIEPFHRQFFDPEIYRIVLFDQRGSGRSTPHASLENNTTQDLVADIERVREHLGIDKWLVFGGSWGSTLALIYAETHPQRVTGLILRGIFLCRDQDIHWFYQEGASHLYPDYWQDFLEPIPEAERGDMLQAYHKRLTGDDEVARMAAAKAWSVWEGRCATLHGRAEVVEHFAKPHTALSLARIEAHYFVNHCFLEPNQILANIDRLQGIPGIIVHGRYDAICPLQQAWDLHQTWPEAELKIVGSAGHSASEPGNVDALISATMRFGKELA
jgi:proline iminopeptidase